MSISCQLNDAALCAGEEHGKSLCCGFDSVFCSLPYDPAKAVAASAESFDSCHSSSPPWGPALWLTLSSGGTAIYRIQNRGELTPPHIQGRLYQRKRRLAIWQTKKSLTFRAVFLSIATIRRQMGGGPAQYIERFCGKCILFAGNGNFPNVSNKRTFWARLVCIAPKRGREGNFNLTFSDDMLL